jgi:Cytochrome c7 and related cytochrome c
MKLHGRVWVAMLLGAVLLAGPRQSRAQFSPGKLSRAHAEIGGPTECFRCHEPRKATTAERCLDCHRELAARIEAGTGFHGRLGASERTQCSTCHAEHGGEEAALVRWPGGKRQSFDHRQTGFALTDKHATLDCDKCHRPDMIRAEDVRAAKDLRLDHTHLGLSTRCADCHTDVHHKQFEARVAKQDCAACHATTGWKPVSFDHATATFKLDGKHAPLACDKCHVPVNDAGARVAAGSPGAFVRYRPVESARCTSCHTDPHRERFGNDCTRCHSTSGWKQLALGSFDHSRTRYPLVGRHLQVECGRCHYAVDAAGKRVEVSTPGSKVHYQPIAHAACTDCHRDPHNDRLGQDCTRCHSPAGWNTITTGAFDHDKTRYPLRGLHAKVACEKCHRSRSNAQTLAFAACTDCHADSHRGQLTQRPDHGACESCHSVDGFSPARFGPQEHEAARFSLQGAHRAVACITCHRPSRPLPPSPASATALASRSSDLVFRFKSSACTACHRDPHAGQFADSGGGETDCKHCHGLATWRLPDFDHTKTRFPLEGAHRRTACASCHRPMKADGRDVARYRPLDTACRSCHAEPVGPLGK